MKMAGLLSLLGVGGKNENGRVSSLLGVGGSETETFFLWKLNSDPPSPLPPPPTKPKKNRKYGGRGVFGS